MRISVGSIGISRVARAREAIARGWRIVCHGQVKKEKAMIRHFFGFGIVNCEVVPKKS